MLERDLMLGHAVREAGELRSRLTYEAIGGQLIMLVVLVLMAYSQQSISRLLIVGLFLATGTVAGLVIEIAHRLDVRCSYVEQLAVRADDLLTEIQNDNTR